MQEKMILSVQKGKAINAAKAANRTLLTADMYLREILREETDGIKGLHKGHDAPVREKAPAAPTVEPAAEKRTQPQAAEQKPAPGAQPASMRGMIEKTRELQQRLQDTVLGQQRAVSVFAMGYFQSELQAAIEKERKRPRATFLFAGPPGVGKTFLAEEAAKLLGLPFQRFDMSEYAGPNAADELSGSDANYKASAEGLLTGFANKNPQCVLLFDEIEKASIDVIHLFLQVMDAGRLRDNRTDREVSFKDAILIFTTNAGKNLYEDGNDQNLSALSREVILDALGKDINPKTKEPFFPAAICSRFASGNVVMFNHLNAHTLHAIVEKQLGRHMDNLREGLGIDVRMDPAVSTAILLAEGASADARTVKSSADSFFGNELYELYRLILSRAGGEEKEEIKRVRFSVDLDGQEEKIKKLFSPSERVHVMCYPSLPLDDAGEDLPVLHSVGSFAEAKETLDQENIQLLLCDLGSRDDAPQGYLNREDRSSPGRAFLLELLEKYPSLPVVLVESETTAFSEEEKESYLRRGIRGFLDMEENESKERLRQFTQEILQNNSLSSLARANQLIRFETAQRVTEDGGEAEVILFDLRLEKAIKASDSENIMSLLSTPDQSFDDVYGAEDAKKELRFFVTYMNDPKKFRRQGASAPRGVLLYGPPGTGKTMLAKAFAAESGATFIATEGNQFFKGIVGQGAAMVHRLFATARRYAPSVIFIDEIDAIARTRTGRDTDMSQDSEQILTALFAEMDGFTSDPSKPVFVLGATNYQVEPGARLSLDPAMLRRFDRRILIDLPNLETRKMYLKNQTDKKPLFKISEEEIDSLGNRSTGMSLAQLASVMDLAIRTAMQDGAETIGDEALEEAFETFNSGEKREWKPEIMLRTARHEAGHALISWLTGEKPAYVTIVSRANYGGYMQRADQEDRMGYTRQELLDRIATALGGRAAEIVCYGSEGGLSTGASGDLRHATNLARQMLCVYGMDDEFGLAVFNPDSEAIVPDVQRRVNAILKEQLARAVRLISDHRDKMDKMVQALQKNNILRAADIDKLLGDMV